MDDRPDSIDSEPLCVRMLYPGSYWEEPQGASRERALDAAKTALSGADVAAIVDADADGRGCEVVLRDAFPNQTVAVVPAGHREDISIVEALDLAADHAPADVRVIVADLCPDEDAMEAFCDALDGFSDAVVCDHHDWTNSIVESVEDVAEFVHDDNKCAAQLVLDRFHSNPSDQLREFTDVTADHDLWIKEDDRSQDLADYAFWADRAEYVEAALDHGANIADDDAVAEMLHENRIEKHERVRLAVGGANEYEMEGHDLPFARGAEWHVVNGYVVALAYGEAPPSDVGHALVERGADVAVLVRPYNKLDFRSADDTPVCADIARELGGGGHPCAAGASPYFVGENGDVSFTEHWETQGEYVKDHVLGAIKHATA